IGLSYVDLYLVHFPALFSDFESGWQEFEKMKKDGLTSYQEHWRQQLYSRGPSEVLKTAVTKPAVNQIPFHPYNYASHKALLEYCAKHNITVEAYGSLNSITQNPGGPVDAVVNAAAKRLGATPNQVIFSWVRSKGVAIVTTSRSKERLQEYLDVDDLPPLTAEEIAAIDDAGAKGPPSQLVVARLAMQHKFERCSSLVMWLAIAIIFGFATFFVARA
ncbi:NADP-dependent oxidoreductase domain-containing protein, partial [Suillus cothurnatus]